jgi:hypothetical protein
VAPILMAEIDRLVAEATRLSDELHGKHLIWLRSQLPPGADERIRINRVLPPPPGVRERDYRTPEDWVAAREALLLDAGAPLPS